MSRPLAVIFGTTSAVSGDADLFRWFRCFFGTLAEEEADGCDFAAPANEEPDADGGGIPALSKDAATSWETSCDPTWQKFSVVAW